MHTATDTAPFDLARVEAFAYRAAEDRSRAGTAALVHLGDRLDLWTALRSGPVTARELADRAGLHERLVRDWLASMATAGYLELDGERFVLPAEHAMVLAEPDSPALTIGGFEVTAALFAAVERAVDAYRTGTGVAWGDHDPRLASGVSRYFRALYTTSLAATWFPAVPGLVERLEAGARVLDLGCGEATSTVEMARHWPASTYEGRDPHAPSIAVAREAATRAGVDDRVTFTVGTAEEVDGPWDVICLFDAFHHLGDPVGVAARLREALADDGILVLVEPAAADDLEDSAGPIHLGYWAASALVCTPDALAQADDPEQVLGGQAGPRRLLEVLATAGFGDARVATTTDTNLVVAAQP